MTMSTVPSAGGRPSSQPVAEQSFYARLDRRRGLGCCSVLGGGVLVLAAALIVLFGWLALTTGLIHLPGLSRWLNGPSVGPTRLVMPEPLDASFATSGSRGASVTLTEGQLTTLVSADRFPAFRQAAVSIDRPQLTVGGYFMNVPIGDPVFLEATLTFPAGSSGSARFACQLERVRFGQLSLPALAVRPLSERVCGETARLLGASSGSVPTVTVDDRRLTVQWSPPPEPSPSPTGQ